MERIGLTKTLELLLTSNYISGITAKSINLINFYYPEDDLNYQLIKFIELLEGNNQLSMSLTKKTINKALDSTFEDVLEYELLTSIKIKS